MVALAENLDARTFEKGVNRRAKYQLRLIRAENAAQAEAALGVTHLLVRKRCRLTNLNRWYDPKVGRWISEDPIGFAAGDANIYRYVGNSPTNWIDPSGLDAIDDALDRIDNDENKQQHITDPKHNWNKVVDPVNWPNVRVICEKVLREGTESDHRTVKKKTLDVDGETVTVTYVESDDGETNVSNGWVE